MGISLQKSVEADPPIGPFLNRQGLLDINLSGPKTYSALPLGIRLGLDQSGLHLKADLHCFQVLVMRSSPDKEQARTGFSPLLSISTRLEQLQQPYCVLSPAHLNRASGSSTSCIRPRAFVYFRWQDRCSADACISAQGAHGPCYGKRRAFDPFSGFVFEGVAREFSKQ